MSEFNTTVKDGIAVISWNGQRFIGNEIENRLSEEVEKILAGGIGKIIINFPSVGVIDSSGLGNLIKVWKLIEGRAAGLVIVIASPRFDHILKVTNLHLLMKIFKTLERALEYFGEPPSP